MSEVEKPVKQTVSMCMNSSYCKGYNTAIDHSEAYYQQELAKEKAKRVELESETTGLNLAHIIYNSIENQVPEYKDLVRTIQDYLVGNQLPEKVMEYIVKEELKG